MAADPLGEVHFATVEHGYDPQQVDELVSRARALLAVRAGTDGETTPLTLLEHAQQVADQAVIAATSQADGIVSKAREESESILSEARGRADRMVSEAQAEADRLRGHCEQLRSERDAVAAQVHEMAERLRQAAESAKEG